MGLVPPLGPLGRLSERRAPQNLPMYYNVQHSIIKQQRWGWKEDEASRGDSRKSREGRTFNS